MFVMGNFFIALAQVVNFVLWSLNWLIIIRALISWVSPDPFNPIVQFLYRVTEPILTPFRRLFPPMAVDLSPILAIVVIYFLRSFLVMSLIDLGYRLK